MARFWKGNIFKTALHISQNKKKKKKNENNLFDEHFEHCNSKH